MPESKLHQVESEISFEETKHQYIRMRRIKVLYDRILPQDNVLKSFIKGSFWAVYGNVIVKGFSFVASLFIARYLGSSSFGELTILKTTLSIFSLLATFGLGVSMTKFIAEKRQSGSEVLNIIKAANLITIVSGLGLGLILVLCAPIIADQILHSNNLIVPLRISGAYLFFNTLTVYQVGVVAGFEAFRQLARINLIVGLFTLPILLVTTYLFGLNGTVIGMALNTTINWFLNHNLICKIMPAGVAVPYAALKKNISELVRFSYPLAFKEIVYSLANWLLFYLLLVQTDYKEVGVFNSANQLSQLILFLPASILNVFLSLLSNQVHNRQNYTQLVNKNLVLTFGITVSIGVILVLMTNFIYQFYGDTYTGGEAVFVILIAATIPMALTGVLDQVCISSSKPFLVTISQLLIQFLTLITAVILFSINTAATSLAWSYLIGYSVSLVVIYLYLKRSRIL